MTEQADSAPLPEFSRPLNVERLSPDDLVQELTATPEERAAVAERLGLQALETLTAKVRLRSLGRGDYIRVRGKLFARVTQTCSVTLAPVVSDVEQSLERTYTFEAPKAPAPGQEIELEPEGEEPPDPIVDGMVDLGELVVEELSLAIDPFPRAEGVVFDAAAAGVAEEKENPFAVLAKLRPEKK